MNNIPEAAVYLTESERICYNNTEYNFNAQLRFLPAARERRYHDLLQQ